MYEGYKYYLLSFLFSIYLYDKSLASFYLFSFTNTLELMEVMSSLEVAKLIKLFLTSLISFSFVFILSRKASTSAKVSVITVRFSIILSSWFVK